MKVIFFYTVCLLASATAASAQSAGIGTTTPDASALLELKATNKGFLPPRMTAQQKSLIPSPKAGLIIYQTDGDAGLYVYNGSAWEMGTVSSGSQSGGPFVKLTTDQLIDGVKSFNADAYANGVRLGRGGGSIESNTVVGAYGLSSNTTGEYNTAVGYSALPVNAQGLGNTATGYNTLMANTTGNYNTANGAEALLANTTGSYNTANGFEALYSNTEGYGNTANGYGALYYNYNGYNNTALGNAALSNNVSGINNTGNGGKSLYSNVEGNNNTASGSQALYKNYGGSFNTGAGLNALYSNVTGSYNTAIGYNADVASDNLTNATAVGAQAEVACSNCLVLGAINGVNGSTSDTKVAVGVFDPQTALHINPSGAGSILIGANKISGGYTNLELGISAKSGGNSYIQSTKLSGSSYGSLLLNPSGGNVGINSKESSLSFPLDIQQSGTANAGKAIRFRNHLHGIDRNWEIFTSYTLNFSYDGNDAKASVQKAYISPSGSYVASSDARLKRNVQAVGSVLNKVMALQPKKYQYINSNQDESVSNGFLAQEAMVLFPELVSEFTAPEKNTNDKTVYHGINYAGFSVIAIKAIQEQQLQIEELKRQAIAIEKRSAETKQKEENILKLAAIKKQFDEEQIALDMLGKRIALMQ